MFLQPLGIQKEQFVKVNLSFKVVTSVDTGEGQRELGEMVYPLRYAIRHKCNSPPLLKYSLQNSTSCSWTKVSGPQLKDVIL